HEIQPSSLTIWISHLMLSGEICVTQFPDNPQPSRGHGILGQAADSVGCELILGCSANHPEESSAPSKAGVAPAAAGKAD
ncbi:TPA: hypothetical protein ACS7X9_003911, partial [Providencia alcalifaciens]